MSNPFIIKKNTELTRQLFKTALGGFFGTKNAEAHRFEISLFRNGERVQLQNSNIVTGAFINYTNMSTVLLSDEYTSVEDGNAIVVLSDGCYMLPGRFCLTINVDDVTVFAGEGTLSATQTDTIYDPDDIVPSLEDVLAQVDAARQAAAAANEAAANASKMPFIGAGGVWYFWDAERGMYVDSENKSIPELTFQAVTGEPGTNVQLVQTGTPDAPVITLTIPRGDTGAVEGIDYFAGSPSALGVANPGAANGVARGDHVHPLPGLGDLGAVGYNAQSLTDAQKQQARENIASVSYEAQTLTDAQKEQARQNIGADSGYTLPAATAETLGGVKLGSAFTAPDGVLTIDGEIVELVKFIEKATYSKNATVQALIPFDENALYIGSLGNIPTTIIPTTPWLRFGGVGIPASSLQHSSVDTAIINFGADGSTTGTFFYLGKFQISDSGTVSNKNPTSVTVGPVYMLRKIAQ